ncbi:hypothetical protein FPZ43_08300 [Mucilaginibacter pallidiroseus]|uniref:Uncharacterized protein n=1 Tax=Mucilaginibacter pallidiroseus TaxID=2599295 RepID=A0A563UEW2_9SPHI|nr:hypothetical protein [Mucilaginibacter pallidiroseus]TWR29846.1 hypothetical protein FPZ43_08300 [Mucilaginibacter pallidiroseus]
MKLYIDSESFEISSSDVITGTICLKLNDDFFPEKNWNDSIALILLSWIKSFKELSKNQNSKATFYFFDGPLRFEMIETGKLGYLKLYHKDKCILRNDISSNNLVTNFRLELLKCCELAIDEFNKRGWITPETIHLNSLIKDLTLPWI